MPNVVSTAVAFSLISLSLGPLNAETNEKRALARAFVESPVQQRMIDDMLSPEALEKSIATQLKDAKPETIEVVSQITAEEFMKIRPELNALMVGIAQDLYTAEELEAMIAFYASPLGASAMSKSGAFVQRFATDMRPIAQRMQFTLMQRLFVEMAK
ncbi:MAG: DUF2059 domain-containing protein [Arenibacterium sp.]